MCIGSSKAKPEKETAASSPPVGKVPRVAIRLFQARSCGGAGVEFLFDAIFQFFAELLLQLLFELLTELGLRILTDPFKRRNNPILSTIGSISWGLIAGGLSALIFPRSLIHDLLLRRINLIVTPLAAGAIMTLIGRARDKRGQALVRLDRFGYAFAFAFAMAIVRYGFAA